MIVLRCKKSNLGISSRLSAFKQNPRISIVSFPGIKTCENIVYHVLNDFFFMKWFRTEKIKIRKVVDFIRWCSSFPVNSKGEVVDGKTTPEPSKGVDMGSGVVENPSSIVGNISIPPLKLTMF